MQNALRKDKSCQTELDLVFLKCTTILTERGERFLTYSARPITIIKIQMQSRQPYTIEELMFIMIGDDLFIDMGQTEFSEATATSLKWAK